MTLIVVESPTKARTFNRILKGKDYYVFATMGHIRDLPPEKLSVDYAHDFKPDYKIIKGKDRVVAKLKELGRQNTNIILATDPDREGESIAYHAAFVLGYIKEDWPHIKILKKDKIKRIVFHEITAHALEEALKTPHEPRIPLIQAQQARRLLDRIVGYELSPILWKKTGKNWLSAGRVQTVALRIIVEREKEIEKFKQDKYFTIEAIFKNGEEIAASLIGKNDEKYAREITMKLFAGDYTYSSSSLVESNVEGVAANIKSDTYEITDIKQEIISRFPPPPFTTSLLQQEAFNRFGFSSKLTMRLAQNLYERGLITYHRTDSFSLSTSFVFKAMEYIKETYGQDYALEKPRGYKTKSRLAQEAHEAIRPTKLQANSEEIIKKAKLTPAHSKLYDLIFARALATQMKESQIKQIIVDITGEKGYLFQSDFQQIIFDGFLKVLNPAFANKNTAAPLIQKGTKLSLVKAEKKEHLTLAPWRYTEASLIKILEERGIGRPSTYAPIISLIQTKMYIEKEMRYFKPTGLGTAISDYLSASFPTLFQIDFTASMEELLDNVAQGNEEMLTLMKDFYAPFKKSLDEKRDDTTKIEIKDEIEEPCPTCGGQLVARLSKFGKFLACSNYPKCKYTRSINTEVPNKNCPKCGGKIVVRYTKAKKRFFGCENYPKCDFSSWTLPK